MLKVCLLVCMCSVSADAFDVNRFMPLAERVFTDGGTDGGGGGGGGNGAQCIANAAASSSSKSGGFKSNGGGGGGGSNSNANANAYANSRESMFIADLSVMSVNSQEVFPSKHTLLYRSLGVCLADITSVFLHLMQALEKVMRHDMGMKWA